MSEIHGKELLALWSLAMALIGAVVALALLGPDNANSIHSTVIAGLAPCLPIAFNSIRNIGQSRAMQSMAEQLGQSAPTSAGRAPLDLAGSELPGDGL